MGSDDGGATLRAFRAVLADRRLRRLQYALLGSVLGRFGALVALGVWAYRVGGPGLVGVTGFLRLAPGALVAPFASALVDRYPRQRVMAASDLGRAGMYALAAGAVAAGLPAIVVLVLLALTSLLSALFEPARAALTPALVERPEQLTAANAVGSTVNSVAYFAGPALGGLLLAVSSVQVVLAATAATLVWSAANVVTLRPPHAPETGVAPAPESVLDDVREGWRAVAGDRGVAFLMAVMFVQTLIAGAVSVFVVLIALRRLDAGQVWVGYLEAASGIGALAGVAVAARLLARARLSTGALFGLVLWGLPLFLVAAVNDKAAALAAMALIGVGDTAIDVSGITLLQRVVPEALLGRVFGLYETVGIGGLALGALLTPALVALAGDTAALAVVAGLPVLCLGGAGLLRRLDGRTRVPERPRALLRAQPMFRLLSLPALDGLALAVQPVDAAAGQTVVEQGGRGDRYYLVDEGTLDVEIDGRHVRQIGPGDGFGEIALLRDVPRTATVVAREPVRLLALEREPFLAALAGHSAAARAADGVVSANLARRAPAPAAA